MRLAVAACAIAAVFGASAHAAPLRYSGTLTVELLPGSDLPPLVTSAAGTVEVDAGGGFALPADIFAGTLTAIVGTPPAMTGQLSMSGANAPGAFAPGGVASLFFGGTMPFVGNAVFASPFLPVSAPLSLVGGTGTGMVRIGGGGIFTAAAAAWRTGITSFRTVDLGTLTLAALDQRTPGGLGSLQMIAPVVVSDLLPNESVGVLLGTLEITVVPEPATGALFAGSLLCLAVGSRRARDQRRARGE